MHTSDLIDLAVQVAATAHKGQKDLDGNAVILHPLTVGLMGRTDEERIVGFLHDVVEDTPFTFDDLLSMGFPAHIVDALRLLTHTDDMTYEQYLERLKTSGNELAIAVKLHDLTQNLQRGRAGNHTKQVRKHEAAWEYMTK